ncbi:hypothetical protein TanjilG_15642 [Lupinus angustifolius]|uniref:Transcriptional corepressor SEUSS n=1 Tax=Lupinus angustifolius TaxID=3871 RepID=A0A1J7IPL0_LUPAN|nr:hypothetical protein TanjilG_15642 [Lupinus angustifolius]
MVHPGQPALIGGAHSESPSLSRSNSGTLGGQGGAPGSSETSFPSLVSSRNQFNVLGNMSNATSLLSQPFSNGLPDYGPGSSQPECVDIGAESDPLSSIGNGLSFGNPSSSLLVQSNMVNPGLSGQGNGQQFSDPSANQLLLNQQHSQQLENQRFQRSHQSMQQFSAPQNTQQQQQQHFQSMQGGIGGIGLAKLESQINADQFGRHQQLPSLRNLAPLKLEPQYIQAVRNLPPVKMEPQHTDQPLFMHQQQQQQQLQHKSRQSSPADAAASQMNSVNRQRLLQLQQHRQQQLLKTVPQQRSHLSQQFQQQNMPIRSPVKSVYEPGMCARRLARYMHQQQHRPEDNSIEFWRKFVAEYFAPNAKKKWCVSLYGSGKQATGVFPQDVRHCEICNRKPGRGFEATAEVLPRLFKIKYESGTLDELLSVDMPREYQNSSGQIVLDYAKAIQESVFEQLRVVREGQLRIVFSPELKIWSWEFCARRHEDLIPRRLLIPQISQLGAVVQKYQSCTQSSSVPELQKNCDMFVGSARMLAKALEVPLVNELGYTKRFVRCLQISEVVNSMKDLIDYSINTGTGPMDSLAKFPQRTSTSSELHIHAQQYEDELQQQSGDELQQQSWPHQQQQHLVTHTSNGYQNPSQNASFNGVASINNTFNSASASTTTSTIVGLLHQNSMNSRQQNSMNNTSSPYGGSSVQIPSPRSSNTVLQAQPSPSPFQPATPSSSNNPPQASINQISRANSLAKISLQQQQPLLSGDADANDAQSCVQKIIDEMMSSQMNGTGGMVGAGSLGNDADNVNGIPPVSNEAVHSNAGDEVSGYGTTGVGPSGMANENRHVKGSNSVMNGRIGIAYIARNQRYE